MQLQKLNNVYYISVLKALLSHLTPAKKTNSIEELLNILKNEIDKSIKEDYRASVLPTTVSKKEGRNFYLPDEPLLSEEEAFELIGDLAGVFLKSGANVFVLKINNSDLFEAYRRSIVEGSFDKKEKEGIDLKSLLSSVGIKKKLNVGDYSNISLFLLLNHFILYILNRTKSDILREIFNLKYAYGIFTVLSSKNKGKQNKMEKKKSGQKKRKYYISDLSEFVLRFYKNEIEEVKKGNAPQDSIIGSFIFSFYINDEEYADKILGLLDKFLYYLTFHQKVNFEILCKTHYVFYEYISKKEKKNKKGNFSIRKAREFYIMMNLEKIYDWAFSIGKTIQEADEENGKDYVNEIIKEIKKEELPGKFVEELSKVLHKISEKIRKGKNKEISLSIHPDIARRDLYGDDFYKVKAAILSGLINSLR